MIHIYEELGDPSRRRILNELRSGPKCVSELVGLTGLKQPNLSNHLAKMKSRGIVEGERSGRHVFYRLMSGEVVDVVNSAFAESLQDIQDLDIDEWCRSYATAAVTGDEGRCLLITEEFLCHRIDLIDIYEQLFGRAMGLIGTWYLAGAIDESHEHMASEITLRSMSKVMLKLIPKKKSRWTVMLGCAENSLHTIGLRMIADYLKINGWTTIFLGANVPKVAFLASVAQHKPNLVLLNCSSSESEAPTIELVQSLDQRRAGKSPFLIGVGGSEVLKHTDRYLDAGADFASANLKEFADRILPDIEKAGRIRIPARSTSL